jgi:hypothetical protein
VERRGVEEERKSEVGAICRKGQQGSALRTPHLDVSRLSFTDLLSTLSSLLSRAAPLPDGSQSLAVDPPRGRVKYKGG